MNKKLQLTNHTSANLNFYKNKVKKTQLLSQEKEYELSKKLRENNDLNAAKILIESHLIYVIKIAQKYSGYGLTLSDLIQEGTIGLMKAVKRFNPERQIRLISFAIYWIKSEIHEYIIKNIRIVKIATTKSQKKLFFNINKFKKIGWLKQNEIKSLSNLYNINKKDIIYMEKRLQKDDISFNLISFDGNLDEQPLHLQKYYKNSYKNDPSLLIEQQNWDDCLKQKLKTALKKLDKRSQEILKNRWLNENKQTLKTLAVIYNISSERIRQLEDNAIQKLKNTIKI